MAQVELTRHLKEIFPALEKAPFEFDVTSVADVVAELDKLAPGVGFYICDELGRLRKHVNVFVGDEMVCDRTALTDRVTPGSRVFIAQALSGG
jgi:sulfur-carrier protein